MITHNINWFLGISIAAHLAVLFAWQSAYTPGHTGHTVHLSVIQQTGNNSEQAPLFTETAAQPVPDNTVVSKPAETPPTKVVETLATVQEIAAHPAHKTKTKTKQSSPVAQPVRTVAATMTSNTSLQQEETDRHIRSSVMELITRELTYPAIARRKGWQGVVKLELHIEADGSITELQVDETSGYSILDNAAMQCLQLASIPGAAQWLQGQAIDIVVPVEYRLVDS